MLIKGEFDNLGVEKIVHVSYYREHNSLFTTNKDLIEKALLVHLSVKLEHLFQLFIDEIMFEQLNKLLTEFV